MGRGTSTWMVPGLELKGSPTNSERTGGAEMWAELCWRRPSMGFLRHEEGNLSHKRTQRRNVACDHDWPCPKIGMDDAPCFLNRPKCATLYFGFVDYRPLLIVEAVPEERVSSRRGVTVNIRRGASQQLAMAPFCYVFVQTLSHTNKGPRSRSFLWTVRHGRKWCALKVVCWFRFRTHS